MWTCSASCSQLKKLVQGLSAPALSLPPCPPSCAAAAGNFSFESANGKIYLLSTFKRSQQDSEAFCQTQGGHLVAYRSAGEQRSVEQQFVSDGFLLPLFQRAYHVGLTRNSSGAWTYTDYFYKGSTYMPWDRNQPAGAGPCAVANTVTARNGIYAFNDADCSVLRPAICVISRGWQLCDVLPAAACFSLTAANMLHSCRHVNQAVAVGRAHAVMCCDHTCCTCFTQHCWLRIHVHAHLAVQAGKAMLEQAVSLMPCPLPCCSPR
jgi:hypothetical protein